MNTLQILADSLADQIEGADDDLSNDDAILIYSIAAGLQAVTPTILYILIAYNN
jgi:hypothetical protein